MKKQEIYINLQGKTKEELTDLWEFLMSNGEKTFYYTLKEFIKSSKLKWHTVLVLSRVSGLWILSGEKRKQEITIYQLKQIIKPMGTFAPIAMKCTQEQFDAVKPKLSNCKIRNIDRFDACSYLINNLSDTPFFISNVGELFKRSHKRTVHETWNEEIFLKACGIEVETLQEKASRLENELKEVNKQIEEENKPKVGDVCKFWSDNENSFIIGVLQTINSSCIHKYETIYDCQFPKCKKITNHELIKLLENECSAKN